MNAEECRIIEDLFTSPTVSDPLTHAPAYTIRGVLIPFL